MKTPHVKARRLCWQRQRESISRSGVPAGPDRYQKPQFSRDSALFAPERSHAITAISGLSVRRLLDDSVGSDRQSPWPCVQPFLLSIVISKETPKPKACVPYGEQSSIRRNLSLDARSTAGSRFRNPLARRISENELNALFMRLCSLCAGATYPTYAPRMIALCSPSASTCQARSGYFGF